MPNDRRTQIDTINFRYLLNIGSGCQLQKPRWQASDPYWFDSRVDPLASSYGLQPNFEPKPKDQAIQWFVIKVSIANTLSVRVEPRRLISTRATYQTYHIMEEKKCYYQHQRLGGLPSSRRSREASPSNPVLLPLVFTAVLQDSLDTFRTLRPGRSSRKI